MFSACCTIFWIYADMNIQIAVSLNRFALLKRYICIHLEEKRVWTPATGKGVMAHRPFR